MLGLYRNFRIFNRNALPDSIHQYKGGTPRIGHARFPRQGATGFYTLDTYLGLEAPAFSPPLQKGGFRQRVGDNLSPYSSAASSSSSPVPPHNSHSRMRPSSQPPFHAIGAGTANSYSHSPSPPHSGQGLCLGTTQLFLAFVKRLMMPFYLFLIVTCPVLFSAFF